MTLPPSRPAYRRLTYACSQTTIIATIGKRDEHLRYIVHQTLIITHDTQVRTPTRSRSYANSDARASTWVSMVRA